MKDIPESNFVFQITSPDGGFGGRRSSPGRSDAERLPDPPRGRRPRRGHPGHRDLPDPPACPAGRRPVPGRVRHRLDRGQCRGPRLRAEDPAEGRRERACSLSRRSSTSSSTSPHSEIVIDRDKVAQLGLNLERRGPDLGAATGGNFVNRFSIGGRSYKVIPQVLRAERLNPDQLKDIYVTGPGRAARPAQLHRPHQEQRHAALAQPLPAAQRREDQRGGHPTARSGAALPRGSGGRRSCPRDTGSTTPASRGSSGTEGNKFLPAFGSWRWCSSSWCWPRSSTASAIRSSSWPAPCPWRMFGAW